MTADDAWVRLLPDYEARRAREDSLDRLVEWGAQRALIGDVEGLDVLDVGCGNGEKAIELAAAGARSVVGIDLAGQFLSPPAGLDVTLAAGDLSELAGHPQVQRRAFDRVLFLQTLAYAADQVATLRAARSLLRDDGVLVVSRAHPIRFAVERSEASGLPLGDAYHSGAPITYAAPWNEDVSLTHSAETFAAMVNNLGAAGFRVERVVEPELTAEQKERYPHKKAWMARYVGIIIFRAVPCG